MFTRLSAWFRDRVRGRHALVGVAVFVVFAAATLPRLPPSPAGSPDTTFLYSAADLAAMAEAYGEAGRAAYVRLRWTFDVAFPIVYGFFLLTTITWAFGRAFPSRSRWQLANLAPLAAVAFDLLENTTTTLVMLAYPEPAEVAAALAPAASALKWLFVAASWVLLLIGLAAAARASGRTTARSS